jgi:ABC-type amino acid transport system permease subunit
LSQLIKGSSVLSVIAIFELHKASQELIGSSFKFAEVFIVESLLYLSFIQAILLLSHALERRLGRSTLSGSRAWGALKISETPGR